MKKSDFSLLFYYISIILLISTSSSLLIISLILLINPDILDVLMNYKNMLWIIPALISIIVTISLFYLNRTGSKQCQS